MWRRAGTDITSHSDPWSAMMTFPMVHFALLTPVCVCVCVCVCARACVRACVRTYVFIYLFKKPSNKGQCKLNRIVYAFNRNVTNRCTH